VLLAALAAEAAQNTKDRSDPPLVDVEHAWSAAERVVLEMVASEVDWKVDLSARYLSAEDDAKTAVKAVGGAAATGFRRACKTSSSWCRKVC